MVAWDAGGNRTLDRLIRDHLNALPFRSRCWISEEKCWFIDDSAWPQVQSLFERGPQVAPAQEELPPPLPIEVARAFAALRVGPNATVKQIDAAWARMRKHYQTARKWAWAQSAAK